MHLLTFLHFPISSIKTFSFVGLKYLFLRLSYFVIFVKPRNHNNWYSSFQFLALSVDVELQWPHPSRNGLAMSNTSMLLQLFFKTIYTIKFLRTAGYFEKVDVDRLLNEWFSDYFFLTKAITLARADCYRYIFLKNF